MSSEKEVEAVPSPVGALEGAGKGEPYCPYCEQSFPHRHARPGVGSPVIAEAAPSVVSTPEPQPEAVLEGEERLKFERWYAANRMQLYMHLDTRLRCAIEDTARECWMEGIRQTRAAFLSERPPVATPNASGCELCPSAEEHTRRRPHEVATCLHCRERIWRITDENPSGWRHVKGHDVCEYKRTLATPEPPSAGELDAFKEWFNHACRGGEVEVLVGDVESYARSAWNAAKAECEREKAKLVEALEVANSGIVACARDIICTEAACIEWGATPERSLQNVEDAIRKLLGGGYAK